jgi:hypothetical protein
MMAILFAASRFKATDKVNDPISGAFLAFYATQTSTFQPIYADSGLTTVLTNPVKADTNGLFSEIWLDDSLPPYKVVHSSPDITDPTIPGSIIWTIPQYNAQLSAQQLLPQIYPITPAETSVGVAPNYSYAADPIADVRRYGWALSNSAAQNTAALALAISVITSNGGGIVQLPSGRYNITDSIVIPENVTVRGVSGTNGTTLVSSSTGNYALMLGGAISGVAKFGPGLTDVQIVLSNATGKAVRLMETVSGIVRNLYIQGPISVGRSTSGVVIDGGNIGAYFNRIENVECSHIHQGFSQLSSGTIAPTMQVFVNISGTGDVGIDTTSIGYLLSGSVANTGNGTVILGADFEGCKQGYYAAANCGASSIFGFRGEGNTIDILCETNSGSQSFFGGVCDIPSGKILVNTSVPLNTINGAGIQHRFCGMANGSNGPNNSYWPGLNYFYGSTAGDAPVTIVAFPGDTTVPILDLENSSGNKVFQVSAQGKFLRIANANPQSVTGAKAGNLALASLVTSLANIGLIVDNTT